MEWLTEHLSTVQLIQTVVETWNELILLILIMIMFIGMQRDKTNKLYSGAQIPMTKELLVFFSSAFIYNLSDIILLLCLGVVSPAALLLTKAGMIVYYISGGFQTLLILEVAKIYIAGRYGSARLKNSITAVQLLHLPLFVILLLTPFTGAIYIFNNDNTYTRYWGYFVWQSVTVFSFVFVAVLLAVFWKKTDKFAKTIIITAVFIPLTGFAVSLFVSEVTVNNIMVAVVSLIMFVFYERNKTTLTVEYANAFERARAQLAEQNYELEKRKLALMMTQIKPHFINNAMLAIQETCYTDPEKAADLINHFAKYLRNNIEATNSDSLVPFEYEAGAVREYLALEYADENKRFVFDFDLETVDFKVPLLSIEPLAENAVKHGIDRYSPEGRVVLKTFETPEAYHIEIRDNGVGFNVNAETLGKGGIGLKNAEDRLRLMCGGHLEIKRSDGWTAACITIQKSYGRNSSEHGNA